MGELKPLAEAQELFIEILFGEKCRNLAGFHTFASTRSPQPKAVPNGTFGMETASLY